MELERRYSRCLLSALLLSAVLPLYRVTADEQATPPHGPEQLVGTWRLTSISRITPQGPESDPFYGDHCTGLLIYDPAGWMSVQITGATRPRLATPEVRVPSADLRAPSVGKDATRESALFSSYYAYFGTWTYDASRGTVQHSIVSSLYPSEQGLTYSQEVRLRGSQMIFTVRSRSAQGETQQVKIWERVTSVH